MFGAVHPDDRDELASRFRALACAEHGASMRLEYRVLHADGFERWLRTIFVNHLEDPAIGAIVATCQDVTDYRQVSAAKLSSERQFAAVFANTLDALLICDDKMRYVGANPAAAALLGRTHEQVLQAGIADITPEPDRDALPAAWQAFLAAGRAEGEHTVLQADGTSRPVEFRAVANILPGVHLSAMRDISARHASQREAHTLQQQLHGLTGRLQSLQEEERHRIAREVHDELGQLLTALKLDLAWSLRRLASGRSASTRALHEKCEVMSGLVDDAIGSVRRIASGLHPAELAHLGLVAAIEAHVQDFGVRNGVAVTVVATIDDSNLDSGTCLQLLRITQEALTNVSRHAHATSVAITLDQVERMLHLVITDNGCGMAVPPSGSLGLLSMKERARFCGGELVVNSTPNQGTSVRVLAPAGNSPRAATAVDA
jgi:PAS domain S-box-containing protein